MTGRRTGHRTGRLAALAVLGSTLLLGPATLPSTASPTSPSTESPTSRPSAPDTSGAPSSTRFELTSLTPGVMTPDATLTVSGILRAGADEPVPAGSRVQVRLQRSLLSTREAVADWVDAETAVGSLLLEQRLAADLAPGASLPMIFSAPAERLRLDESPGAWGPRGMTVTVRNSAGTEYLATTRTHMTWFPAQEVTRRTPISVLLPVTGTTPDPVTGVTDIAALTELTAPGGRLDAVLQAAGVPGVTLALDPSVLDAAPPGDPAPSGPPSTVPTTPATDATEPADSTTPTQPADPGDGADTGGAPGLSHLETWRERVRAVAAEHDVLMLPYGDPDLAALAHSGEAEIARLCEELGRTTTQGLLAESARTDIAWVPGGDVDPETLDLLAGLGRRAVVLDDRAQPLVDPPRDTVAGRSTVEGGSAPTDGLVDDGPLSSTLASVGSGNGADSGVRGVARLLADTAAIALERPDPDRHLLVTAPRDWDPLAAEGVAAVTALTSAPWVEAASLQELLDTPPDDAERAPVSLGPDQRAGELPTTTLSAVGETLRQTQQVTAAFADPAPTLRQSEATAVALASAGWRDDIDGWRGAVDAYRARLATLRGAVRVVPGSTVTQVSRNVELPVTLENTLDQAVTVVVDVQPESSRLVVTRQITETLPAQERRTVRVPVRGVGNGDTSVRVQLLTEGGAPLGAPVSTRVLVRADWETRGTLMVAGGAALVLVVGLVRTFRRGPRRRGHDPLAVGFPAVTTATAATPATPAAGATPSDPGGPRP